MWGPGGRWYGYNTGVLHRPELRTLALDLDMKGGKNGEATLRVLRDKWEPRLGRLPETLENLTPTGGKHLVYRMPDDWSKLSGEYTYGSLGGRGIDVLFNGKQNVWSGSWLNSTVNAPYMLRMPVRDPAVLSHDWLNTLLYGSPSGVPAPGTDPEAEAGLGARELEHRLARRHEPRTGPDGIPLDQFGVPIVKMDFLDTVSYLQRWHPHRPSRRNARLNGMNPDGSSRTDWNGIVFDACERLKNAGPGNWHRTYGQQVFRLLVQGMHDDPGSIDWADATTALCAVWEHVLTLQGWYDPTAHLNKTDTWCNLMYTIRLSERGLRDAERRAWAQARTPGLSA